MINVFFLIHNMNQLYTKKRIKFAYNRDAKNAISKRNISREDTIQSEYIITIFNGLPIRNMRISILHSRYEQSQSSELQLFLA